MDIPESELIVQNNSMTADQKASEQEELMKLLENAHDIQFDGIPKSSQASASASAKVDSTSNNKPKASRHKDTQPEARQGVLRAFLKTLTKPKDLVVLIFLAIMSMLLKLAGEPTLEREPGKMFANLLSVYSPFPITFGLLCFFLYDWTSDICSGQSLFIWGLIVSSALTLTALSVRLLAALTRLISRDR